jgi:hypothetical protein
MISPIALAVEAHGRAGGVADVYDRNGIDPASFEGNQILVTLWALAWRGRPPRMIATDRAGALTVVHWGGEREQIEVVDPFDPQDGVDILCA